MKGLIIMPMKLTLEGDSGNPAERNLLMRVQQKIDNAQSKLDDARKAIQKGESVEIPVSDDGQDGLIEAYRGIADDINREVWGCPLTWNRVRDSWIGTTSSDLPTKPPFCMSCGAVVGPIATDARWHSPGKAGVTHKATGWEHKCVVDCAQAGHFPMDDDNPYTDETNEAIQYIKDRLANWKLQAEKRAKLRFDEQKHSERAQAMVKTFGHDFLDSPECRKCGLALAAYLTIPKEALWLCAADVVEGSAT